MQAISLHPQRRLIVVKQIVLCALALLTAVIPVLCLPVALLMPLFACPLISGKEQWTAYATAAVPAIAALLYGGQPVYALGILLAALLPVVLTAVLGKKKTGNPSVFFVYTFCAALAAAVALLGISTGGGKQLSELAADRAVSFVMEHPQRTQLLHQALATGMLPVPAGYSRITLFNLLLDPLFLNELRLSLHSRVAQLVNDLLPTLFAHGSIILGLFTGLRVQRMRNAVLLVNKDEPGKVCIAVTPGFSMLRIPEKWHIVLLLFMLQFLFAVGAQGTFRLLSMLLYQTFVALYQLQGAAVICGRIAKDDADRKPLAGVVAAALYLFMPLVLFIVGCWEKLFSFRRHTEDDNHETDNHEEEEP